MPLSRLYELRRRYTADHPLPSKDTAMTSASTWSCHAFRGAFLTMKSFRPNQEDQCIQVFARCLVQSHSRSGAEEPHVRLPHSTTSKPYFPTFHSLLVRLFAALCCASSTSPMPRRPTRCHGARHPLLHRRVEMKANDQSARILENEL